MRAINKAALLVFVCASSSSVMAEEWKWGLAGSFGDQNALRFPITNGDIVIEPFISRSKHSETREHTNTNNFVSHSMGVGVWKVYDIEENFSLRTGLAASYYEDSRDYKSLGDGIDVSTTADSDGYSISPGVGLFYHIKSNLSVGLEATYNFTKTKGDAYSSIGEPVATERNNEQTRTQAVIEFYF